MTLPPLHGPDRRYWRKLALVMGADISWGIVDVRRSGYVVRCFLGMPDPHRSHPLIHPFPRFTHTHAHMQNLTAALGITPTELEGPDSLAASPPQLVRKQQAAAVLASTRMRVVALKQDPAFRAEGACVCVRASLYAVPAVAAPFDTTGRPIARDLTPPPTRARPRHPTVRRRGDPHLPQYDGGGRLRALRQQRRVRSRNGALRARAGGAGAAAARGDDPAHGLVRRLWLHLFSAPVRCIAVVVMAFFLADGRTTTHGTTTPIGD